MKAKILILLPLFATLFSCSETLEERAFREAYEFTKNECPVPLSRDITIDSLTFDNQKHTFTYYYSVSPKVNCELLDKNEAEKELLTQLRNQPALRKYKEAKYSFRYIYYPLVNSKNKVIDVTFTYKDYK